ncbi:MAG: LamG domain-containing protein, partial [Planctomycetes bacterium]|nr:LamG domain-containing protein [Planctomycetota bacterium]
MKSLVLTVVVCLAWGLRGAMAETPAAPNMPDNATVLLWHLDAGGGNTAADAATGGKLAGKITGAEWVDGRFGKALKWGADNGNVQVRGDFSAIRDAFTLQAWVYLERLPTGQPPFWASDVVGKLKSFVITVRPPGVLYVGVQLGEQPNWLTGQTPIPVQRWTHVALVYDGAAGKIGTFVDGKLDAEFDLPPSSPRTVHHADHAFIVRSYSGSDEKLVGMIDEVFLSSRAHTFGHRWRRPVYLHALRYSSAFLLGMGQTAQGANPTHSVALSIEDAERRPVLTKRLTAQEAASGAVIPAPGLAAGQYRATVTLTSADGATETALDRVFRYTPPQTRLVDIRPDGVCVAQGKPFFPLGLYHVAQKDLKAVAEAGFNAAFAFASTLAPNWPAKNDGVGYIEKCGEHGLMGVGLGGALHKPDIGQTTLTHYQSNP